MMHSYHYYYQYYPVDPLGLFLFWLCGAVFYFLPTLIAFFRRHPNTAPIFLLNFLLGWTMLGWVVALVWSFTAVQKPSMR